ncbi:MAG TPA: chemotaxis protein CheC [Dehalococcoidia bacterium]|jgi:chemotaxis protein CheC|nr:chemotaxis protein CheC [Dehalococcoidia bacterium]
MTKTQTSLLESIIAPGALNSIAGLSGMLGEQITATSVTFDRVPIDEISERAGGPERTFTGVYLAYWGSATGHMTLLLDPAVTSRLLELLIGRAHAPGTPFDEIERSALGELGNIVGSSFLNSISDATGLLLRPSPPDVIVDMIGAVVDIVAADDLSDDMQVYLAEVRFASEALKVEGTFLVVPSSELVAAISQALVAAR